MLSRDINVFETDELGCCQPGVVAATVPDVCPPVVSDGELLTPEQLFELRRDFYTQAAHDPLEVAALEAYHRRHPEVEAIRAAAYRCAQSIMGDTCPLFYIAESDDGERIVEVRQAGSTRPPVRRVVSVTIHSGLL
jgi:hypothetical protein